MIGQRRAFTFYKKVQRNPRKQTYFPAPLNKKKKRSPYRDGHSSTQQAKKSGRCACLCTRASARGCVCAFLVSTRGIATYDRTSTIIFCCGARKVWFHVEARHHPPKYTAFTAVPSVIMQYTRIHRQGLPYDATRSASTRFQPEEQSKGAIMIANIYELL